MTHSSPRSSEGSSSPSDMPDAHITAIRQETRTVKSFQMDLGDAPFTFMPGQWLDLYLDDPELGLVVGGFSMTSSPVQKGYVGLAVKRIPEGQASVYLHDRMAVGDQVSLDGGYEDFYYHEGMGDSLVLVAGGIGITPLMSMIRYVDEAGLAVMVKLLYSSSAPSELVFCQELEAIAARNTQISCHFTVTSPGDEPWDGRVGRIDLGMLEEHGAVGADLYFLCGPRGMPRDVASELAVLGVDGSRIRSEEW